MFFRGKKLDNRVIDKKILVTGSDGSIGSPVLEKRFQLGERIMQTKTKYEEIVLKELRAFPDEAIPQVVLILQSVRKGICITQKAISKKSDPSGLCGIWKDNRSSGEIIEDIRSHRTGFGKRQIEF